MPKKKVASSHIATSYVPSPWPLAFKAAFMSARTAPSLFTSSTSLCADSVESVPGHRGLFALATYQVDKQEQEQAQAASSSSANQSEPTEANQDDDDEGQAQASSSTSPAYTRRGTCSLYSASLDPKVQGQVRCDTMDMIETPALLDMKWSLTRSDATKDEHDAARRILGIANAKGQVTLHRLSHLTTGASSSKARLQSLGELRFNDRNALCLSLDFSDRRGGFAGGYDMGGLPSDTSLIVSQSDGSLAYLPSLELALSSVGSVDGIGDTMQQASLKHASEDVGSDAGSDDWDRTSEDERAAGMEAVHLALNSAFPSKPRGLTTWRAHEFEAWIAGFDCFNPTTVWSGGDDLTLKGWDLRSGGPTPTKAASPTFTCTKPFDGGVTSLQSHHLRQHLWAVGSYDSRVRLFDSRMPARPLSETDVGGGVWRIKWHPTQPDKLLVACMHDGFKVLSMPDLIGDEPQPAELRGKEFEIVTRFDEHKSLAYGCDWDRAAGVERGEGHKVYSCSFYDATMHVWDGLKG